MSFNTLDSTDTQKEATISEIAELMELKGLIQKFQYATCGFILEETPKLFGHIPEIMTAWEAANRGFEDIVARKSVLYISETDPQTGQTIYRDWKPGEFREYCLTQKNEEVYKPVNDAIREHFRQKLYPMGIEIAKLAIHPEELMGLMTLLKKFAERDDLDKPFPNATIDKRWNWNLTFPTKLNGQDFEGMIGVSPDSGWKMSFYLTHPERGKKGSGVIQFENHQSNPYIGIPSGDMLFSDIYEYAESSVRQFYKMREEQRAIQSGETYGDMDVFTTGLKLIAGEKFSEAYPEDPIAAYALSIHMTQMQLYNSELSAPELASASEPDQLEKIINDPPTFIYHVMRGIIRLFKHMLMEANGEPGILRELPEIRRNSEEKIDPSICAPQRKTSKKIQATTA